MPSRGFVHFPTIKDAAPKWVRITKRRKALRRVHMMSARSKADHPAADNI